MLNLPAANQAAHLLHGEINRQVSEFEKAEEGETNRWVEVERAYAKALEEQAAREARTTSPRKSAPAPRKPRGESNSMRRVDRRRAAKKLWAEWDHGFRAGEIRDRTAERQFRRRRWPW